MTVVLQSRLPIEECALRLRRIIPSLPKRDRPPVGSLVGSVGQDRFTVTVVKGFPVRMGPAWWPTSRFQYVFGSLERTEDGTRIELRSDHRWREMRLLVIGAQIVIVCFALFFVAALQVDSGSESPEGRNAMNAIMVFGCIFLLIPLSQHGNMRKYLEEEDRVIAEQVRNALETSDQR